MTRRARAAGWRTFSTPATPPQASVLPSITQASSWTVPRELGRPPKPTESTAGSSSTAWAPAMAASRAGLPWARSPAATLTAVCPNGQVAMTRKFGMVFNEKEPAAPARVALAGAAGSGGMGSRVASDQLRQVVVIGGEQGMQHAVGELVAGVGGGELQATILHVIDQVGDRLAPGLVAPVEILPDVGIVERSHGVVQGVEGSRTFHVLS